MPDIFPRGLVDSDITSQCPPGFLYMSIGLLMMFCNFLVINCEIIMSFWGEIVVFETFKTFLMEDMAK